MRVRSYTANSMSEHARRPGSGATARSIAIEFGACRDSPKHVRQTSALIGRPQLFTFGDKLSDRVAYEEVRSISRTSTRNRGDLEIHGRIRTILHFQQSSSALSSGFASQLTAVDRSTSRCCWISWNYVETTQKTVTEIVTRRVCHQTD